MTDFSWAHFFILWGMGTFGAIAVMPYAFTMQRDKLTEAPLSLPVLGLISAIQGAVLVAIVVGLGLLLVNATGLNISTLDNLIAGSGFNSLLAVAPLGIIPGAGAIIVVVLLEALIFRKHLPPQMRNATHEIALWKRFLAGFYGGITEELITRLFMMSLLVWLLGFIWQTPEGATAQGAYWLAILGAALIFGLLHLPATKMMAGKLSPMLVLRALLLNGIGGVAFGWVFWQYGLLAAMLGHFAGDMILHIIAPMILRPDDSSQHAQPTAVTA